MKGSMTTGQIVRHWRGIRGLSQVALADAAGVSTRHMSFVENGRSKPSRDLLVRLARRLQLPSRETNGLLEGAGYSRHFDDTNLADPQAAPVRTVLEFLLQRHEPFPACVVDLAFEVIMKNQAFARVTDLLLPPGVAPEETRENVLLAVFHPEGLKPYIVNWRQVAAVLSQRVHQEALFRPTDPRLAALVQKMESYGPIPVDEEWEEDRLLLPLRLEKDGMRIKLFTVLSTVGTATDAGVQDLRVETFFPADPGTRTILESLAGDS